MKDIDRQFQNLFKDTYNIFRKQSMTKILMKLKTIMKMGKCYDFVLMPEQFKF